MVQFSQDDKAVIKNDYEEKGWNAYTIWKEHPAKNWDRVSVWRLVKKFEKTGSMDRKKGSGRPVTATAVEHFEEVEELVCSQEEEGTHSAPRKIADEIGVSRSSVQRICRKQKINQFKRMSEPQREEGTLNRRSRRAQNLVQRFEKNKRSVEKLVWQDEKDFPLQVPLNRQNNRVYFKGKKSDVPAKNLFFQTKRQSKKSWFQLH